MWCAELRLLLRTVHALKNRIQIQNALKSVNCHWHLASTTLAQISRQVCVHPHYSIVTQIHSTVYHTAVRREERGIGRK